MVLDRSVAEQIEHWAGLGKTLDGFIGLENVLRLKESGTAKSLSECIAEIGTAAGQQRLKEYLARQPFPHFEGVLDNPDQYIRIEADGTRMIVKFVDGEFVQA